MSRPPSSQVPFIHRILVSIGIVALVLVLLLFSWYFIHVLLLIFAGILLAIFLRGLAVWLSAQVRLSTGWSLILVVVSLFTAFGGGLLLFGPLIGRGFQELTETLPQALEQAQDYVRHHQTLAGFLERFLERDRATLFSSDMFDRITGIFSTVVGTLTGGLIILANGLYFSAEPDVYMNGIISLVPLGKRDRVREVLRNIAHALHWWMVGRIASMTLVGILTWTGLTLLGLPGAVALAFLAGLLSFVPNIGPVLSAVPAVLVGLMQGPHAAFSVAMLYVGVQTVESYFLTPLIQERVVSLPPALIVAVQLAMGIALGVLGVLLATPLALSLLIMIQMLYVEDVLGDHPGSL